MKPTKTRRFVRLFKQNPDSSDCVPAALISALNTFGIVPDSDVAWYFKKLKKALGTTQAGTHLRSVRSALKPYPVLMRRLAFKQSSVKNVLKRGGLALVTYDSAPGEGHLSIICGYYKNSDGFGFYELADPLFGYWEVPALVLEANAKISGFWCRSIEKENSK